MRRLRTTADQEKLRASPISRTKPPMRIIAEDLQFPEGPLVLPDGTLALVEIRRQTLTQVDSAGRTRVIATLGGGPNGAALGPDGAVYVCNNGGFNWVSYRGMTLPGTQANEYSGGRIERVDLDSGRVDVLFDRAGEHMLRGPNDIVFDAHGGFWFTDLGKHRRRDSDNGGIYYALADGSAIREVVYPMSRPNGIGLSPDGQTLYAAETQTARLWAWDVSAPGELAREAFPSPNGGRLIHSPGSYRLFDSLALEAGGNICVATLMQGGISVCAAAGGLLEFVAFDDPFTTNICFGGSDMCDAYVTLSGTGRLAQMRWPRPGLTLNH